MIYMLDANILRHYVQDAEYIDVIEGHMQRAGMKNIVVSSVAVHELMVAILNAKLTTAIRNDLKTLLDKFHALPFDERAAYESASIEHELRTKGEVIGKADTMIAGHARSLGMTLVTNNQREFKRVRLLPLENWIK